MLFLCTGNSCRSQMAEGWLRHLTNGRIVALSAGTAPMGIHPNAVRVMGEEGVDLTRQSSESVTTYLSQPPDLLITVCSAAARDCPTFPGHMPVLHWPFDDPAEFGGEGHRVLEQFRRVRDEIRGRIEDWLAEGLPPLG